jgi:PAS domain S-box-containing protein
MGVYIDEMKKLSQFVQDEKQRYKAIMDLASDGIHIIDEEGNVVNYSCSFSKMLGYNEEEMKTLNIIDWEAQIKPENDKDVLTSLINNPRFLETKYKRKDGTIFDVEINAKGIEIDNKTYLYASARDVSDKKEFERSLKKSESKFHTLVEESLDGIVLLNLQTQHFIEFNKKTLEMYGYTQDEFLKLKPEDLDVIHNQEQILKTQQNIITKGWDRFETKHKTKEGKILDISVSARKIDIDEQAFLYVSFHDITEQKNIESLLLSQKDEFESLFRQSGEGIAILDLNANFLDFNEAYIKMLGYTREELKQRSCIDLSAPEDRERSIEALSQALSQGYLQNFEKICIAKDGKKINVSMTATLLSDKQRFLIVTKDMTSFKLVEEQYRLASMGEMIGNIAHQWRQPLSVISSIASSIKVMEEFAILEKHDILPDMEKIIQQSEYLSRTIDDFKNFIKDSEESKELNIKDILEKALLILHPAIVNSHIKIVKNISCDIKVDVNENELVQSFINIINNAKDAVNENVQESDDRYIFITMDKNIDNIKELSICDTGGGISQNVINRIFEPYFTTKHQSVGTGLGLSMTHKIIVEKYKFSLNVVNKEIEYNGKRYYGACFVMQFEDN